MTQQLTRRPFGVRPPAWDGEGGDERDRRCA